MKKILTRHATTIALVCAAAGAGVWFYVDRGGVTTTEAERRKGNVFPVWRSDDLTGLVLESSGRRATLRRTKLDEGGSRWELDVDDQAIPTDLLSVDRLLGTLEYATIKRRVADESVDRPAFGLDAPSTTLTVEMGAQRFELRVGGPASAPEGTYVELVGHGVFVVAKELGGALAQAGVELRSRDLVPFLSVALSELRLGGEGGDRHIERAPWSGGRGSGFRFAASDPSRAGLRVDAQRLDQVFHAFSRMQAEPFLEASAAEQASVATVRIELRSDHGERAELLVGGDCPGIEGRIVVRRTAPDPIAACVPKSVLLPLSRTASDLEDRGLIGASADEVAELVLQHAGSDFELARKESAFVLKRPEARDVAAELGKSFLEGLIEVRGAVLPDTGAPSFEGADVIELRLHATGGLTPSGATAEREEKVVLGPVETDDQGARFRRAFRHEDGRWLRVSEAEARVFASAPLLLRDRKLVDVDVASFRELRIVEGKRRQVLRFGDDGTPSEWVEPKVRGLGADPYLVRELTRRLGSLEAVRWVAERDDGSFGLGSPRIELSATLAGESGERKLRLRLGALTDDGPYATIDDRPEVFIAPRELERSLGRWLLDTTGFMPPLAEIDALEASVGARSLKLEREGPTIVVRVEGRPAGEAVATELRDAIASMRPMGVVSVGAAPPHQGLEAPALRLLITPRRRGAEAASEPIRIEVGAGDTYQGLSVRYARRPDLDASFAVPQAGTRAFFELLGD